MPQYPVVISGNLFIKPDFGLHPYASYGTIDVSVASAGDVNGDGFADFMIGIPGQGTAESGASYVIFGKAAWTPGEIDLTGLDGSNGFRLLGVEPADQSGFSVSSAGDVNGDGFDDIMIGAPSDFWDSNVGTGASYVVFGTASGFDATIDLSSLHGANGFKLTGEASHIHSGFSVSTAGDINGDDLDDVMVGANDASYVVFGTATAFDANTDLSTLDGSNGFKVNGGGPVASASDVNGDGHADFIVGNHVVFGRAEGFGATLDVSTLNGSNGFTIGSAGSIGSAGDVNGDGFADLVLTTGELTEVDPDSSYPRYYRGAAYVVFGKATGFAADLDLTSLNGSNGFKMLGRLSQTGLDYSFAIGSAALAGDVNGDGFDDILIGQGVDDLGLDGRSADDYVVFGNATAFDPLLHLPDLDGSDGFRIGGTFNSKPVASAGDINGDGLDDVIGGGPQIWVNSGWYGGNTYIVLARLPDSAVTRIGTDATQSLVGGNLDDRLSGRGGDDELFGHGGDDGLAGEAGDDVLNAGAGNDIVNGGTGNDTLIAGAGNDAYDGGAGVDTIVFTSATQGVVVDLSTGQATGAETGIDQISRVENVVGGGGVDSIVGSAGANTLDGRGGADTMAGLAGNDTYFVDNAGDVVNEAAGGGFDRVLASVHYVLAAGSAVEVLETVDAAATNPINLTGNELANRLTGNAGSNRLRGGDGKDHLAGLGGDDMLDGGTGIDIMEGGAGNDVFAIDRLFDQAIEAVGGGIDRVFANSSYALAAGSEIEFLQVASVAVTTPIDLTGNEFANTIIGHDGRNIIAGGAGADTMSGLGGNDFYVVDNARDVVNEDVGDGNDLISASVHYVLADGAEVETLQTVNSAATNPINLTGNEFASTIIGNAGRNLLRGADGNDRLSGLAGDDTLHGGAGVDFMQGGAGNDAFTVDNDRDRAIEEVGGGIDRVYASASHALVAGSEVEILQATDGGTGGGTTPINLTGNEFDNTLLGNNGNNIINGGAGNDTLRGRGGSDSFLFNTALDAATNIDSIVDFNPAADSILLKKSGVFAEIFKEPGTSNTLAAAAFHVGAVAHDVDDRIIYNGVTGVLMYDANGSDLGGAMQFASLDPGLTLTNQDFFLV